MCILLRQFFINLYHSVIFFGSCPSASHILIWQDWVYIFIHLDKNLSHLRKTDSIVWYCNHNVFIVLSLTKMKTKVLIFILIQ